MKTRKGDVVMVPPDGGWGWIIVLGSGLITFSTKSIQPTFGLIFGELLKQLGVETTGVSLVTSTMDALYHFSGLAVGPLIRKYTYRKVAILGSVISSSAILLTVPANSMLHILITFGVMGGIGFGLVNACTLIGINDYFSKKKGQAVGLSMTGTGVGFILMPQVVRLLLDEYDYRSALLIVGALSLNAIVGATLFQPVSWHKKAVMIGVEEEEALLALDEVEKNDTLTSIETTNGTTHNASSKNFEDRKKLFYGPSNSFSRKESLIYNIALRDDARNTFHKQEIKKEELEKESEKHLHYRMQKSVKCCLVRFAKTMDLDLLKDVVYINILYGVSMCIVAEMNFKVMIPFFLLNLGFTVSEIALALSLAGVADICARTIVPPIVDRITISWRVTFLLGLICVAIGQFCVALQMIIESNQKPIIIITLVSIGFFQGITLSGLPLVLAEYTPGYKFPSVLGLSMVSKGIFIAVLGPLSGYIRDITDSYPVFIYCQVVLLTSVLITWTIEIFFSKFKNKKQILNTKRN